MNKKNILKTLLGIVILVLLVKFFTTILAEPWVKKKIMSELNEKIRDYNVRIDKVHILLMKSGIEIDSITISSKEEYRVSRNLNGKIASIKFKGIHLLKAIFKKGISINVLTISNSNIKGKIPISGKDIPPKIAPLNIRIGRIIFDKTNLEIESTSTAQAFMVKEGDLKVYDLHVKKQDTLTIGMVKQFDFDAEELASVSADSMYSYKATGIIHSVTADTFTADSFFIHPNYKDYDFTSHYKYQTNRIEANFYNVYIQGFNTSDFSRSGSMTSSYTEIGKMDMKVFRDKRKEFRHVNRPTFQEMIYKYRGFLRIDSINLINGNITFTPHAERANEPGYITFNKIRAKIYKITNDTIYKTKADYLELKGKALLMGKGRIDVFLKSRIFDRDNTFLLNGTLSDMEADELNPILEKNAFVYVTSGKIDEMKFSFTANNKSAIGKMNMLYHGLNITVKNKRTDDTTAIGERLISFFANIKVIDSNPLPGKKVREGIIEYERDPERFLFNYCFKSILSGIKSSIIKNPKKNNKS